MKKRKEYDFLIEDTAFPGSGVAMYEGTRVHIKGALPGQKVRARVTKNKEGYSEAKLTRVLEDVDYKIEPSCPHFGVCGGCTHQFIDYEKQLQYKEDQVLKLFKAANIENYEFLGIEGSPEVFEYRNKMEFSFGDFEKGGELTLGMHIKNKSFGIVGTNMCQIVDEDFRKILTTVVEYFKTKELPYYKVLKHEGYLRNLVVRKAKNTGEILINIVTTSQVEFDYSEITELLKGQDYKGKLTGIIHTFNDSLSDVVQADKVEILFGSDYITGTLLGLKFKITSFSFFQTNSLGAEKLYSMVRDFMGDADSKVVFDLYCGTGTIGQIAAKEAEKVVGIELIEEAVEAANENAALNGLTNCHFIAGDIAKVITQIKEQPDIIILDPPRPGVHPTALDYVIKFNAKDIIYVSCNPESLVRDLKVLIGKGYVVGKFKVMDM
ncbi:MAG: 23S rRNA (uracil(1939)-C(5))-methyltransferase RlmD, partial [Bacillota bacterium]|nr:23S rRNA (uracil(1939)-C(5))-methyltransferase RlmD [Bacillota bacterium]